MSDQNGTKDDGEETNAKADETKLNVVDETKPKEVESKPAVAAQEPKAATPQMKPAAQQPKAATPPPKPAAQQPKAATPPPKPAAQQPKAATPPPKPAAQQPKAATPPPKPAAQQPKAATPPPKAATQQPNPAAQQPKAATPQLKPAAQQPKAATPPTKAAAQQPKPAAQQPRVEEKQPLIDQSKLKAAEQKPKSVSPKVVEKKPKGDEKKHKEDKKHKGDKKKKNVDPKSGEKMDESDVVVDQGNYHSLREADEDEISGHRAIYVGVHVPLPEEQEKAKKHHHKHRHKSKSKHKNGSNANGNGNGNGSWNGDIFTPNGDPDAAPDALLLDKNGDASERVKFLLGDEEGESHETHEIFTEMDELCYGSDGEELEWKEMARWIKYEEDVDVDADRWSKPHVATLPLHSLFELRTCLINGTVCLDMEANNIVEIADLVLDKLVMSKQLDEDKREPVREALLRKHHHQNKKKHNMTRGGSLLPMIRSFADIGRSLSQGGSHNTSMEHSANLSSGNGSQPNILNDSANTSGHTPNSLTVKTNSSEQLPKNDTNTSLHKVSSHHSLKKRFSEGRLSIPHNLAGHSIAARHSFMRKIPPGAEASNVLVGEVDFLSRPIIAFVRLQYAVSLGDLTEVPIPTRFLFILLGPKSSETKQHKRYHEIGRCIATLMSDKVFHDVAYKAKNVKDLLSGIDEFIDSVTVLPPGAWDPNIRIEPPKVVPDQAKRFANITSSTPNGHADGGDDEGDGPAHPPGHEEHEGLERTGKIFGGLIKDIKRRYPFYLSDFKDCLHLQCVASFIFMYFACITPVITFGGLLGEATRNQMSALESLLGASICGVAFHLFSGQPLTILGSTGPILIYEKILVGFCDSYELDYLSFRWWIGLWTMTLCIILVATDASSLVKYFTRFIEESFSSLISFIFIYESVHKLIKIYNHYPVARYPNSNNITEEVYECMCETPTGTIYYEEEKFHEAPDDCKESNGTLVGNWCGKYPPEGDVFLMSLVLMIGTFTIAYSLKSSRTTGYFPTIVRTTVSDFAVLFAVLIMVGLDLLMGVNTPKLIVPSEFKPTSPDRKSWFIDPFNGNPWWTALAGIVPALLATILVFMDQQITAVIVNRKENKFKKGLGYHLDLLVVAIMLGICSIMGLPWFVAATVLSINHVSSLKVESECKAPGEQPVIIGCREQRVTGVLVFIMIGLATLMTGILVYIPMPVLYGVFLFMGISSLKGVQFVDRIALFFMPIKYQPDYVFLRHVEIKRVYIFTFIQLFCLIILWVIKSTNAALVFPIMVLALVGVRKLMDRFFTQQELMMLDDVMPERTKRAKHDRKKKKEQAEAVCEQIKNIPGRVQVPLSDGNMLSIPVDNVEFHPDVATINIPEDMAKTGVWKTLTKNAEGGEVVHRKTGGGREMITPHHRDSRPHDHLSTELPTIPGSPRESSYLDAHRGSIQEVYIEVPEQFRRTPSPVKEDHNETSV